MLNWQTDTETDKEIRNGMAGHHKIVNIRTITNAFFGFMICVKGSH